MFNEYLVVFHKVQIVWNLWNNFDVLCFQKINDVKPQVWPIYTNALPYSNGQNLYGAITFGHHCERLCSAQYSALTEF